MQEGLALTKSSFEEVEAAINGDKQLDLQALKSTFRTLNKHFQTLQREHALTQAAI